VVRQARQHPEQQSHCGVAQPLPSLSPSCRIRPSWFFSLTRSIACACEHEHRDARSGERTTTAARNSK
jgi:hypothetical protein